MRLISIIAAASYISQFVVHAVGRPTDEDMNTMAERRLDDLIDIATSPPSSTNQWLNSIHLNGTWSDVDYTSGCEARRSNWPAGQHLVRTAALAAYYVGNKVDLIALGKALSGLNYWMSNDWNPSDCLMEGGKNGTNCPCDTPGLWSQNWFNQVIMVPQWIGNICTLLKDHLAFDQKRECSRFQERAFAVVNDKVGPLTMTGANLLDVSSVGINLGLFNSNKTILKQALNHFYKGIVINSKVAGDGIQSDGSFMQHKGILYNGNYGKDFITDLMNVFIETAGTKLEPSTIEQNAFATLIDGTEWMIVGDSKLNLILWQYSAIGRMISTKYADGQASGGVDINIADIADSGEKWDNHALFDKITDRLSQPTKNANQGGLVGTRYFYDADYLVHRAPNYVVTYKMYSSRTANSECVNSQNAYGFHLSDGSIFTYQTGDEYVDVFGAWNWNLVPGITVDVDGTPLDCSQVKETGKKHFVGGATDGNTGIAVMDYINPINYNLAFKKTVFFFPSGYGVQIGPVTSKNSSAPLVSVLDQRRRNGEIYINGAQKDTDTSYNVSSTKTVWHDSIGYYFPTPQNIYIDSEPRKADWASFGISEGSETSQLFTSYIKHNTTKTSGLLMQYIAQPQVSQADFASSISQKVPFHIAHKITKKLHVNAAYSETDKTIALAFWTKGTYQAWHVKVTSSQPCVLLLRETGDSTYRLTVADPTHKLKSVKLRFVINSVSRSITVRLPSGKDVGQDIVKNISFASSKSSS